MSEDTERDERRAALLARLDALEDRMTVLESPTVPVVDPEQRDVTARTLWGEARGEGQRGMEAVAAVIMNRVRDPRRWPNTPAEVSQQPWQFSCWNANDPNLPQLMRVTDSDPQFRLALNIAERAITGILTDPTHGANHFHTHAVNPSWSRGVTPIAIIGNHRFFRL